jgi:exoribonuclease-2
MKTNELVEVWNEGVLCSALYLGTEKGRLKLRFEDGEEIAVSEGRLAYRSGQVGGGARALQRHREQTEALLPKVDVAALWEVLVDEGGDYSLEELAGLALGQDSAPACAAVLKAISAQRRYFSRIKERFAPSSRLALEQALLREQAERTAAGLRERFLEAARQALRQPGSATVPEGCAQLVTALEQAAVGGDLEAAKPLLRELRPALSEEPPLAAFRLLQALGVYGPDENLFVRRFELRDAFPESVRAAAGLAATKPIAAGRRDLTGELLLAIDDEGTVEVDDALSVSGPDALGRVTVGVHISDPAHFVELDSPVDREALQRAATYYLPERRLPMLPPEISEQAASLSAGSVRPALSFLLTFGSDANLLGMEIVESLVRVDQRLTYDQADALLAGGAGAAAPALGQLKELSDRLAQRRVEAGALLLKANEPKVKVGPDGEIRVSVIDPNQPSRLVVGEWMVVVNGQLADRLAAAGVPTIYRRQPAPEGVGPLPRGIVSDPVQVAAFKRRLKRAEIGLEPGPHAGLGLAAYTQVTSPLRRYQDLAMHRQLKAWLHGEPLVYDAKGLWAVAATTEAAEKAARQAERGSVEYWLLRYLEGRLGAEYEALVLSAEGYRTEIELLDLALRIKVAPHPEYRTGAHLRLTIAGVDPRAGKLEVQPARRSSAVLR